MDAAPGSPPRTLVVVNTRARDGTRLRALTRTFAGSEIVRVPSADEAHALLAQAPGTFSRVVIVGGDGAVNVALRALRGSTVPVVIVPAGSANDLARALRGDNNSDKTAGDNTGGDSAAPHAIDVLDVNGQPFCTVGGLGFPAAIAHAANSVRATRVMRRAVRGLGHGLYSALALAAIARGAHAHIRARIRTDDVDTGMMALDALFVCNQPTVAGSVRISPRSLHDDGVFELCAVPAAGRGQRAKTLARMLAGVTDRRLARFTCARATIELDAPAPFFGDGEILTTATRFELTLAPRAFTCSVWSSRA